MTREIGLKAIFWTILICCCCPLVSAPLALVTGIAYGIIIGNPWGKTTSTWSKWLLQASVVGLGFGMNMPTLVKTGKDALLYTAISISLTMAMGYLLGRFFNTSRRTSTLISFGTAICGGSGILRWGCLGHRHDSQTDSGIVDYAFRFICSLVHEVGRKGAIPSFYFRIHCRCWDQNNVATV